MYNDDKNIHNNSNSNTYQPRTNSGPYQSRNRQNRDITRAASSDRLHENLSEEELRRRRHRARVRQEQRKRYLRKLWIRRIIILGVIPLFLLTGTIGFVRTLIRHSNDSVTVSDAFLTEEDTSLEELIVEHEDTTISFLAVGDNIGHERVIDYADANSGEMDDGEYDFTSIYSEVEEFIQEADIAYVNQETILGGDDLGTSGYPVFNSPEQWAYDLATVGFDVVNGSNNHSLDKGYDALITSIETFSLIPEILYVGLFESEEAANAIQTLEVEGVTFAFLSYTEVSNSTDIPNDYCINFFNEDNIREDVANAKAVSDVVIVSAHWGTESSLDVNEMQETYAQLFADLEVDVVIGTHTHTLQSIEWVEGENSNETLVVYSLGNFVGTMDPVDAQLEGMLTFDVCKDDNEITIENVTLTPLVNHYDSDGNIVIIPLNEYSDELNAEHYILETEEPNAIEYYENLVSEIIDSEFL